MWLLSFYRSPLGKKVVMAVTGFLLFGFVLGHMVGNLKLYQGVYAAGEHVGEYKIDVYGAFLREMGAPMFPEGQLLWIARLALLFALAFHLHAAISLTRLNRRARPKNYEVREKKPVDYAAYTMRWGGVVILLFVIYHLMHLTWGNAHPSFEHGAVHDNVVAGFQQPIAAGIYILANLLLGLHLYHGLWSMFQSLGWSGERFNPLRKLFAQTFAVVVTLGNVSFPLAVLTGMVA